MCHSSEPWWLHSKHLKHRYDHTRFITAQEEWLLDPPKHFTNLTLIHYKGKYTERDSYCSQLYTIAI